MTGVFPEPLVAVRGYASPDLATEDHRKLVAAGLDASIASTYFEPGKYGYNSPGQEPVQLRVPESQVEAASKILDQDEEEAPTNESFQPEYPELLCPLCHTGDPHPLPPYVLLVGCIFTAGMIALQRAGIVPNGVFISALLIGLVVLFRSSHRFPKWRCKACGTRWGDLPKKPLED